MTLSSLDDELLYVKASSTSPSSNALLGWQNTLPVLELLLYKCAEPLSCTGSFSTASCPCPLTYFQSTFNVRCSGPPGLSCACTDMTCKVLLLHIITPRQTVQAHFLEPVIFLPFIFCLLPSICNHLFNHSVCFLSNFTFSSLLLFSLSILSFFLFLLLFLTSLAPLSVLQSHISYFTLFLFAFLPFIPSFLYHFLLFPVPLLPSTISSLSSTLPILSHPSTHHPSSSSPFLPVCRSLCSSGRKHF